MKRKYIKFEGSEVVITAPSAQDNTKHEYKAKKLIDNFKKMGKKYTQISHAHAKQCAAICVQNEIDLCEKLTPQSVFLVDGKFYSVIEYIIELQSILTSIKKQ